MKFMKLGEVRNIQYLGEQHYPQLLCNFSNILNKISHIMLSSICVSLRSECGSNTFLLPTTQHYTYMCVAKTGDILRVKNTMVQSMHIM